MAVLHPGSTVTASSEDGGWRLAAGDVDGRIRGNEIELGDLSLRLQRTGMRSELVRDGRTPVLRVDRAGHKATTLTTSSARFRLARQRPRPLLHRWRLTRDVQGETLLTVHRSPLGVRATAADGVDVPGEELVVLALAALLVVLDVEPAAVAA